MKSDLEQWLPRNIYSIPLSIVGISDYWLICVPFAQNSYLICRAWLEPKGFIVAIYDSSNQMYRSESHFEKYRDAWLYLAQLMEQMHEESQQG